MRVIIIGAGLGGLTLAHGLRGAGIEVAVYERNLRAGPQPASYGIHINGHGNRALHACLPAENWDRYDCGAVPAPDVVRFRAPTLATLTALELSSLTENADPIGHRRAVRRQPLHQALLHGLEDVVEWDKTFSSFTRHVGRRVQVQFADGTTTEGDLLVGADGSNSRVRHKYLPALVRHELGILNVAGRLPLSHPAARALPRDMTDGSVNNVVPRRAGWLFASTWPASPRDTAAAAPDEDFLVWAYAAGRRAYPDDVDSLGPRELQRWVATRVSDWDPRVTAMISASSPDTIAPVPLRSMTTLPDWSPSQITLLGDAIHNMTPMAGIGANTALRDADALRRSLTGAEPVSLVERVARYEDEMRAYANEALTLSTRNARNAASDKRLPRLAFRTLLKVTDSVAPIKRRVFPGAVPTSTA
ncbi:FAD-dependent oxidoreductase [Actinomycetospora sp. CA-101289]|uniref:FAD-dependent oxidoreductase n=1 Tax=Actinomycetospora sp. CA-101289 TaxID=3239893 RepID=UPI003D978B4A